MQAPRQRHDLVQSRRLDNITRGLLTSVTRGRYISALSVTELISSPTIFDQASGMLRRGHAAAGGPGFAKSCSELTHHTASKRAALTQRQ
jgi:hypothetical protein